MKLSQLYAIFIAMCSLISIAIYNLFKATMVTNSTTMQLAPSSLNKAFIFAFLAPIHPSKTARPNVSFGPPTTSCAPCFFQASMPPAYWVESLYTATRLFNLHPTKTLQNRTPHQILFGTPPIYDHLRVFRCRYYPNLSATMPHKLAP